MGKPRLLIVEDDLDVCEMLRIYFSAQNYHVDTTRHGADALEKTRQNLPHLIILDIMLPDIDGFDVCRALRTATRTSHVPIIFLTQKDERGDKLQGFELGADDYITKPFDIDELAHRARRAIARSEQQSLTDPRSGLPSGRLIEEKLRQIIRKDSWAFLDIKVLHFQMFREIYGFVAADNLLRFAAVLLGEVVDELGSPDDFIGHSGEENFIIITDEASAPRIIETLCNRFADEVLAHYSFIDREQGFVSTEAQDGSLIHAPLMKLAIGAVYASGSRFADIREITEQAAEVRRNSSQTIGGYA